MSPQLRREPPEPSPDNIDVQVDDAYRDAVDADDLARAAAAALASEGQAGAGITLVITGDEEVQALNRQYRDVDAPTDVLSFPSAEAAPGFVSAPEAAGYLGDILIAFPFTQRQAAELNRSLVDELRLLTVHGTLHLLGYDHAEPDEEARMWARQDAILAGLPPSRRDPSETAP